MPLIKVDRPDVGEALSREIEYQRRRGHTPLYVELSPEAHEAMRLLVKAPGGAVLREHDGLPVRVVRTLVGVNQWRVVCRGGVQVQEKVVDAARAAGRVI